MSITDTVAMVLSEASKGAFIEGCLRALENVPQTLENREVFQNGVGPALIRAVNEYMSSHKEETMRVFSDAVSDEQRSTHATSFADFFLEKGRSYVDGLIADGSISSLAATNAGPVTQQNT